MASLVTPLQRARFLGALAPHSADWLEAMPIANCGLFLSDDEVRIAVGLRLGATLCLRHPCPCRKEVDALGLHCFACKRGSGKQMRHSLLNETVVRSLQRAGIQAKKEPLGLCSNEAGTTQGKRPDGVTLIPWRRGRCVTWDVTVADTYAASYVGDTSLRAGAAAERAASRKLEKYRHLEENYIFIPLACEVAGAWCEAGSNFFR